MDAKMDDSASSFPLLVRTGGSGATSTEGGRLAMTSSGMQGGGNERGWISYASPTTPYIVRTTAAESS
jgi:hypothetical protein